MAMFFHVCVYLLFSGHKLPYKISNGVRLGDTPIRNVQVETITRDKVKKISTVIGGCRLSTAGQYTFQNGGVVQNSKPTPFNLKQTIMKIFPVSTVQVQSSAANRTVTTAQSTVNTKTVISSLPSVNQPSEAPLILDPKNLPFKNMANGQRMVVQVGKQMNSVQGAGGDGANNMTFLLVPFSKPAPDVKGPSPSPSTLKHQLMKNKVVKPLANFSRNVLQKRELVATVSSKSNGSPIDITNEMILKAKAVLDRRKANQAQSQVGKLDVPSPSFPLKITPPRLYDLSKHAITSGHSRGTDLAKFLSHIHSRRPLTQQEIKSGVFERGECNPGMDNSSFGVYRARKNGFLSSWLSLERVGSKKLNERSNHCNARTRLQRLKLRRQLMNKSLDPRGIEHMKRKHTCSGGIDKKRILQKKRTCTSVLWRKESEPKRIKCKMVNRKKEVKFKQSKKPQSFWYATGEDYKKSSHKDVLHKPLKELVQPGLIVLKRKATKLPRREISPAMSKKTKKCEEVTIGGKVIKIKQEPASDEELVK